MLLRSSLNSTTRSSLLVIMAPKKKAPNGKAAKAASKVKAETPPVAPPPDSEPRTGDDINKEYKSYVIADLKVITDKFPALTDQKPLPLTGADGFKSLTGHGAPFEGSVYNEKYSNWQDVACHTNLLQHNILQGSLSYIPLYRERVLEYAASSLGSPNNVLSSSPLVLEMSFANAENIVFGDLQRISPCETIHALLHRVATRIRDGADVGEVDEWAKVILSYPTTFKRIKGDDARAIYDNRTAEAMSLRQDAISQARAVGLTARQLVHNIVGFKKAQEAKHGITYSTPMLANFVETKVRLSKDCEHFAKKSTIDLCLTIDARLFSIPGIEKLVADDESDRGPLSFFNSLYRMQELISRCGKPNLIEWTVHSLMDGFRAAIFIPSEISVALLRSGPKSVTDVLCTAYEMKKFLLGKWMTEAEFIPTYVKEKARELFMSHASYRKLWHPHGDAQLNTNWLFSFPKPARELLDVLELAIYLPAYEEDKAYRNAVKNNMTPSEIIKEAPFKDQFQSVIDGFRLVGCPEQRNDGAEAPAAGVGKVEDVVVPLVEKSESEKLAESSTVLVSAANRILSQQGVYVNEQPSIPGMIQELENTPLACVKASPETGKVLILVDCNVWGETDHRPRTRSCPIGKDKIENAIKAAIQARQGRSENQIETIQKGDIYMCIDGGKSRFRQFSKHLKAGDNKTKSVKRTIFKKCTLNISEHSWRARRSVKKGHATLTQGVYFAASAATWQSIKHVQFETITGSTRSDSIGPINLDSVSSLPTLPQKKKKEYYARHWILAGGKVEDDASDDECLADDLDESEADECDKDNKEGVVVKEDGDPAIAHHCLPSCLVSNIAQAYGCKHIVDLTPTPLDLAFQMVRTGGSYCAVVYSPLMNTVLRKQLFDKVIRGMVDPKERLLYDPRFKAQAAGIGTI